PVERYHLGGDVQGGAAGHPVDPLLPLLVPESAALVGRDAPGVEPGGVVEEVVPVALGQTLPEALQLPAEVARPAGLDQLDEGGLVVAGHPGDQVGEAVGVAAHEGDGAIEPRLTSARSRHL